MRHKEEYKLTKEEKARITELVNRTFRIKRIRRRRKLKEWLKSHMN